MLLPIVLYVLLVILVSVGLFWLWKLLGGFRRYRLDNPSNVSEEELPSVSVCIPARNEVHSLVDCLERVIASTYSKMEIIVLDDHSVDETPNLIKSFASAGVRFVEGKKLPQGWLGKNYALHTLAKEASGSIIFFMDVDTRIEPETIGQLVAYMDREKAAMVSVMPRRNDGWRMSVILSPLRYFWEVIFDSKKKPASASNSWLIKRTALLHTYHDFEMHRNIIQPETAIAAATSVGGAYRFLISNTEIGVGFEKKWHSQLSTSVRILYPLAGESFVRAVLSFAGLLLLLAPHTLVVLGIIYGWGLLHWFALGVAVFYTFVYTLYTTKVWRRGAILGGLLWPLIVIQEALLMIISTERHIKGSLTWRGRPIRAHRPTLNVSSEQTED